LSDTEEIEKLYNKKEKTHEDMIKILNISGLRGCNKKCIILKRR
jgi:hypothetical protein